MEAGESVKDKLTEDRVYTLLHRACAVELGGEYHQVECATEDCVFLTDLDGDEYHLSYPEFMEELSACCYDVKFFEMREIEI